MQFLLATVSGFVGGVFVRSLTGSTPLTTGSWEPAMFFALSAGIFGGFWYFKRFDVAHSKATIFYTLAVVLCLSAALGAARMVISESPLPATFATEVGERVQYDGVVVADPDVRDANQRVQIKITRGSETTRALAVAPRYPEVRVGERVFVSGTLEVPEAFADDNGRTFRYDKYLERDGVRFLLSFAYLRVEEPAPWYSLPAALARVKHSFIDGIRATLPEPHASLAGGITIGGKSGLGNDLKEAFTRSSIVHIIVLSGYNVMVVAEWVMAALALTALRKRWAVAAGALALILFVGIAGATATAIRAALMAVIALYARATGRTYAAGRALLVVILLMLIWNPFYLVFDPGFGLSVVATAGLIWLAPIIEMLLASKWGRVFESMPSAAQRNALKNFSPERAKSFWRDVVATTLAAQIAVLPLLLYSTGNLSFVAIPTNLLVVPLVPLAMAFSALAGLAGMLFGSTLLATGGSLLPLLGIILAFPAYLANAYLLFVAQESSALPLAAVTLPPFPFWLVLLAYAGLIYVVASKRFSTTDQFKFAKKASM